MELKIEDINKSFVLAKGAKGNKKVACTAINQAFYSLSNNEKVCRFKDKTQWRYFRKAMTCRLEERVDLGSRVCLEFEKGIAEWFYVLSVSTKQQPDGTFLAIAAL